MNWFDKRICVTGGRGFLGRHLVKRLKELGCEHIFIPAGDLRVRANVDSMYMENEPEIVIHLAASCGGIGANQHRGAEFFFNNLIMGAHLIDAAHKFRVPKFVTMGSACEYPGDAVVPTKEEYLWNGYPDITNASYGMAKRALLVQGQAYRKQYGLNVIHLLMTNIYGPLDNFDLSTSHAVPAMIRQCVEAQKDNLETIKLWGSGNATRDLLYVGDAVEGILLASEFYNEFEPVNLGSGREISIKDTAEIIRGATSYKGHFEWDVTRPDGQMRRVLNTDRAKAFGFTAKTSLEQGIANTVKWYKCER